MPQYAVKNGSRITITTADDWKQACFDTNDRIDRNFDVLEIAAGTPLAGQLAGSGWFKPVVLGGHGIDLLGHRSYGPAEVRQRLLDMIQQAAHYDAAQLDALLLEAEPFLGTAEYAETFRQIIADRRHHVQAQGDGTGQQAQAAVRDHGGTGT